MTTDLATMPCRVVQVSRVRMNPYVGLLQQALRGVGITCSTADGLSPRLAQSWRPIADIVHVHWLELLYAAPRRSTSLRRLCAVLAGLARVKALGLKLVYTVHNLEPHERSTFRLPDRVLITLSDAVHVHDQEAQRHLKARYGSRVRTYVIPHGSYIGAYLNNCTKQEARERLHLKQDAFVLLFLGQIRRYKGVEDLVAAFHRLTDDACTLVIAGNVHDPSYAKELATLTRDDPRVVARLQYVRDAELQYLMNACDVCVLPYRQVTTSGAAILAFSFGRPIVAPELGGFAELAREGRGITYAPEASDGLLGALQQVRASDTVAAGARALQWAQRHQWSVLAPEFARMYEDVLRTHGPGSQP
jgi:beta-1,4-mannosyltransferase